MPAPGRAVLVTGATKGIGAATARYLDRKGLRVFAGFRNPADADLMRRGASPALTPVPLDVTDSASVAAAADTVADAVGDRGLWGIVNNAGIVVPAPLEVVPLDAFREQFNVNVDGVLRVTQAFIPLVRQARGRIVNVSSVNGRLVTPWSASYAASKFALEALSDGFRAELGRWGIRVVVIQPGAIQTPIWETTRIRGARLAAAMPEARRRLYQRVLDRIPNLRAPARALPAERVATAIHKALTARRPRARYRVGPDARLGVFLAWLLPDWLITRLVARRRTS